MFGYKLIKEVEIENLKRELANAKADVKRYETRITELENTIEEKDATIVRLSDVNVKSEQVEEKIEKPVKKVRRRAKKNIKNNTGIAIALLVFLLVTFTNISSVYVIVGAIIFGLLWKGGKQA